MNSLCFFFFSLFPEFFVNVLLCTLDLLAVNGSNITFFLSLCLLAHLRYFTFCTNSHSTWCFVPLIEKDLPFMLSAVQCFWFSLKKKYVAKCELLLKRKRDICIVNNCVIQYETIAWVTCLIKTEVHVLGKCYFVFLHVVLFKLNFLTAGLRWLVACFFLCSSKLVSQPSPPILHCSSKS